MTKKSELEAIRQSILNELFRMCIEMGRDPDTLDVDVFAWDEPNMIFQNNFNVHCHKLQVVEKQLREIQ